MYKYKQTVTFMMLLLIYLCLVPFAVPFIIKILGIHFKNVASLSTFLMILTPVICSFLPGILYFAATNENIKETLKLNKLSVKNFFLIVLMAFLIQPVANFIAMITSFIFPNNVADIMETISSVPVWVFILVSAILPAVFEELIFRGIILSGCHELGTVKSAFVSGLFFGIMHLDPHQFIYAFLIGIIFSVFVIYSNSILASITAHFIINGTQGLLILLMNFLNSKLPPETSKRLENASQINIDSIISVGMSALIFGILFSFVLVYFIKSNKENPPVKPNSETEGKKIITVPFIAVIIIFISYLIIKKIYIQ